MRKTVVFVAAAVIGATRAAADHELPVAAVCDPLDNTGHPGVARDRRDEAIRFINGRIG